MLPESRLSTHPGEIIVGEFLTPLGRSVADLATHIDEPLDELDAVVRCQRPVGPRLAWKLGMATGTGPQLWMNLQSGYDLTVCRPSVILPLLVPGSEGGGYSAVDDLGEPTVASVA